MKGLIVADSSPLIALLNIGRFALLEKLFSHIVVPNTVADEVARSEAVDSVWFTLQASHFVQVTPLQDDPRLAVLLLQIDPGESAAILLADQLKLPLLIDEKAGRNMAALMGLKVTGLVGILAALHHKGIISSTALFQIVQDLDRVKFRLGADLKRYLLQPTINKPDNTP